jgi:hypothetical protein
MQGRDAIIKELGELRGAINSAVLYLQSIDKKIEIIPVIDDRQKTDRKDIRNIKYIGGCLITFMAVTILIVASPEARAAVLEVVVRVTKG